MPGAKKAGDGQQGEMRLPGAGRGAPDESSAEAGCFGGAQCGTAKEGRARRNGGGNGAGKSDFRHGCGGVFCRAGKKVNHTMRRREKCPCLFGQGLL